MSTVACTYCGKRFYPENDTCDDCPRCGRTWFRPGSTPREVREAIAWVRTRMLPTRQMLLVCDAYADLQAQVAAKDAELERTHMGYGDALAELSHIGGIVGFNFDGSGENGTGWDSIDIRFAVRDAIAVKDAALADLQAQVAESESERHEQARRIVELEEAANA